MPTLKYHGVYNAHLYRSVQKLAISIRLEGLKDGGLILSCDTLEIGGVNLLADLELSLHIRSDRLELLLDHITLPKLPLKMKPNDSLGS